MHQVTALSADLTETLRTAHVALFQDLRDLCECPPRDTAGHLRTRLIRTRHDLVDHFHSEERGGYFASIRNREPRLNHTLDQLAGEHCTLLRSLDDILADLERPHAVMDQVVAKVQGWSRKVREHEIREDDVLQDAFAQDLGGADD
jgi:Hemerythrin HHE cation binding domain